MIGARFGRLFVEAFVDRKHGHGRYSCRCDCGAVTTAREDHLRNGRTTSCGCFRRERGRDAIKNATGANVIHGGARRDAVTPEYRSWHAMLQRCNDPKHRAFHRYGGRGISVCERWNNLVNFVADMGSRPSGTSLDRINNDGNYEPGNCRWATAKQQRANQSPPQEWRHQSRAEASP
ncbi:MAG: hypothetical protein Q8K32_11120 [Archangium sp.]|nr:hypothetical protein [Archangium sp.]